MDKHGKHVEFQSVVQAAIKIKEETMLVQHRKALTDLLVKVGLIHRLVVIIVIKEKKITAGIHFLVNKKVHGVILILVLDGRHVVFQCAALKVNVKQRIMV
jgi:hypothetical protein